jgi:hypothetical protein
MYYILSAPSQSLLRGLVCSFSPNPFQVSEVQPYFIVEPSLTIKHWLKTVSTVPLIILIRLLPKSVGNQINSHVPALQLRNCTGLGSLWSKSSLLPWQVSIIFQAAFPPNFSLYRMSAWFPSGSALSCRPYVVPLLVPVHLHAVQEWTGGTTWPPSPGLWILLFVQGGAFKQPRPLSKGL